MKLSMTARKVFGLLALTIITLNINACGQSTSLINPIHSRIYQSQNQSVQSGLELLIKFKQTVSTASVRAFHKQYGTRTIDMISGINVHVVKTPANVSAQRILNTLSADPRIEYVEVNRQISIANTESKRYVPGQSAGELLVRFKRSTKASSIRSFHSTYGTRTVKVLDKIGVHIVKVPTGTKVTELLKQMKNDERIQFVEINKDVHINPKSKKSKGIKVKPIK